MIRCETIQPRLTAYLDGELADADGSVVRGHLRECAACRQMADAEATLRDGLRALPTVDPPPSLWLGVQAQLAAAEVADAHQPRWRRALARVAQWRRWMPTLPQLAVGSALAAAAVVTLSIRARRADDGEAVALQVPTATAVAKLEPAKPERDALAPPAADPTDVTADLAAEPARMTASYAQAADELMKLASEARPRWSDEHRAAFDTKLASLRDGIARAGHGRAEQRAQRALIRYLQGAVVRDEIVLASGGAR